MFSKLLKVIPTVYSRLRHFVDRRKMTCNSYMYMVCIPMDKIQTHTIFHSSLFLPRREGCTPHSRDSKPQCAHALHVSFSLLPHRAGKIASCIPSNTALGLGVTVIARLEIRLEGLQWDNAAKPLSSDDDFHMGYVFMMLLLDAIVYYVIAW